MTKTKVLSILLDTSGGVLERLEGDVRLARNETSAGDPGFRRNEKFFPNFFRNLEIPKLGIY